jgi:hypothetical protein
MISRTLVLGTRLLERLRSPEGAFIVTHATNSILGFALTFAQFFVFVRVLQPGFFAQIILLTTAAVFLMPVDEAVSRFCYVLLGRSRQPAEREAAWRSIAGTYLLYAGLCGGLILAVSGILVGTTGAPSQICYFVTCLGANAWLYQCQAIGWALARPMVFEGLEFCRKAFQMFLLAVLYATGDFPLYVIALAVAWPLFYAAYFRLQGGALTPNIPSGVTLASMRPCLAELRQAFGGSLGQFALMNVPYALASALFGVGSPIIVLDVVLKIVRAALHAFHLSSESFLQRQTAAFHAGDRSGVIRTLLYSICLACVPAALLLGVLCIGDGLLFRALLGAKVGMLPPDTTPLLIAFVFAALFLNAATSFLSFLGFFREMLRIGFAAFAGLIALGIAGWLTGATLVHFLWVYFGVFLFVTTLAVAAVLGVVGRMRRARTAPFSRAVIG